MQLTATEKEKYFSAYKLLAKSRDGIDPQWMTQLRLKGGAAFEKLDFPTTRLEEWKYTNIAPILKVPFRQMIEQEEVIIGAEFIEPFLLTESADSRLVFVNGLFADELSDLSGLPDGVIAGNLTDLPDEIAEKHLAAYADYRGEIFTALNTANIVDGAFVYVPEGRMVEKPIHLLFISTCDEATVSHPRSLIVSDKGAIASVIESYVSPGDNIYFTNAVTEVFVAEKSVLNHYRLQEESERAFHIGTTEVFQERDSNYSSCSISLGGEIVRHNLNAVLSDEHIESTIDGLYVVTGNQHVDNHTMIDHRMPHCASHQLYKGILDGRSRAVFSGKIFVHEGAQQTDANQLNKNLLLSGDATANTKPQLEIFADDVKCTHGATVGQLEDEELFYLATRGIDPERSKALLTYGFAEDVISRIKLKSVRERLDMLVMEKLHQSLEVI